PLKKNKSLTVASESPDLYTTKRLLIEGKKLKYSSVWQNPYQQMLSLKRNPSANKQNFGLYLIRTSGIRYDDFDLLVGKYCEDQGHKVSNPLSSLNIFRKKDEQALFFQREGLFSIDSIIYRGELDENYWEEIKALSKNETYILKMVRGNQGIGVNLLSGAQSLKSLLETFHAMKDQKFLIQPFVEHKKEWRIFVIKNEIMGTIERSLTKNDFRGNSKRSSGKFVKKIPSMLEAEVLRAASLSGLDYFGADVIENKGQFTFLEMNPTPGFLQMEELSGLNIARELITRLS
ncbi:MAG: ATP-grasp domain-containing protein, partial [Bacteriovorax sp.]